MPSINTMITGLAVTALSLIQISLAAPAVKAPPKPPVVVKATPTLPVNGGKFPKKHTFHRHIR